MLALEICSIGFVWGKYMIVWYVQPSENCRNSPNVHFSVYRPPQVGFRL